MDGNEIGRRIRTARAFGGYRSRHDLAQHLQISKETLQRIEVGRREAKRSELLAIAEACEVPVWFLDGGWEGWARAGSDIASRADPGPLRARDLRHLGASDDQGESA